MGNTVGSCCKGSQRNILLSPRVSQSKITTPRIVSNTVITVQEHAYMETIPNEQGVSSPKFEDYPIFWNKKLQEDSQQSEKQGIKIKMTYPKINVPEDPIIEHIDIYPRKPHSQLQITKKKSRSSQNIYPILHRAVFKSYDGIQYMNPIHHGILKPQSRYSVSANNSSSSIISYQKKVRFDKNALRTKSVKQRETRRKHTHTKLTHFDQYIQ